jgi:hypothetical protein
MSTTDASRLATLEKRLAELATQLHYQDAQRVEMEKAMGAIDMQLIRTDTGLHQLRKSLGALAKPKAKSPAKAKPAKRPAKAAKRGAKAAKRAKK